MERCINPMPRDAFLNSTVCTSLYQTHLAVQQKVIHSQSNALLLYNSNLFQWIRYSIDNHRIVAQQSIQSRSKHRGSKRIWATNSSHPHQLNMRITNSPICQPIRGRTFRCLLRKSRPSVIWLMIAVYVVTASSCITWHIPVLRYGIQSIGSMGINGHTHPPPNK